MADAELDLLGLPKPRAKKVREKREVVIIKSAVDAQKFQLEKLMKNPDKEVFIPERKVDSKQYKTPDFVRNVMGSSAGAGSGEFHVYRQLRKKENVRMRLMEEEAEKERLDREFEERVEAAKKAAEERTAKKREKRKRKKQNMKQKQKKNKPAAPVSEQSSSAESDEEGEKQHETQKESEAKETVSEQVPEASAEPEAASS